MRLLLIATRETGEEKRALPPAALSRKPEVPSPARVVTSPTVPTGVSFRMAWFPVSATKSDEPSKVIPSGEGGVDGPRNAGCARHRGHESARGHDFPNGVISGIAEVENVPVGDDSGREVEPGCRPRPVRGARYAERACEGRHPSRRVDLPDHVVFRVGDKAVSCSGDGHCVRRSEAHRG